MTVHIEDVLAHVQRPDGIEFSFKGLRQIQISVKEMRRVKGRRRSVEEWEIRAKLWNSLVTDNTRFPNLEPV